MQSLKKIHAWAQMKVPLYQLLHKYVYTGNSHIPISKNGIQLNVMLCSTLGIMKRFNNFQSMSISKEISKDTIFFLF